ncbi:peptide-methionine (S)-S-oxide reductase MsrA [Labrys monachus]|uniref:Peptide methionine sulfoxide reductase MsrA n=1 Tax=Labrys monachus TaxID=217067 RepID=A0ABU0F831_9HYPH|nr:peptide-methionine (S)-S-oxide reductase MsrA [Labrys monachus]MDQ0390774.1 peptide-methionine (S)-S-oxide reductase [Labrys monachus]
MTKPRATQIRTILITGLLFSAAAALRLSPSQAEEAPHVVPAPQADETAQAGGPEVAVLAGGCFWGVQGVFQHVKGVTSAVSGYAGGDRQHAQYEIVSTGTTGHAESVRVTFDPRQVSYGKILQIYFSVAHDPTELNRQGPDSGTQYRSQIFTTTPEQARIAAAYVRQLDGAHAFAAPIVTRIGTLKGFYPAEAYHQDFLTLHPDYPYIAINDIPKVEALQSLFPALYRPDPVLVAAK